MLARVRAALPTGGRLLLRVGDAAARRGFAVSQWVDRCRHAARAARASAADRPAARGLAGAPRRASASRSQSEPMHRGTPFANVLLVATVVGAPTPERRPMTPATLDHAGIEALIPHRGTMCLLDRLTSWDATRIECVAVNHRDPRHPLRSASGLLASARDRVRGAGDGRCTARSAPRPRASAPSPGFLASARDVRLACWRLDDLPPRRARRARRRRRAPGRRRRPAPLRVSRRATHGRELAAGRVAVVLDAAAGGAR